MGSSTQGHLIIDLARERAFTGGHEIAVGYGCAATRLGHGMFPGHVRRGKESGSVFESFGCHPILDDKCPADRYPGDSHVRKSGAHGFFRSV